MKTLAIATDGLLGGNETGGGETIYIPSPALSFDDLNTTIVETEEGFDITTADITIMLLETEDSMIVENKITGDVNIQELI